MYVHIHVHMQIYIYVYERIIKKKGHEFERELGTDMRGAGERRRK